MKLTIIKKNNQSKVRNTHYVNILCKLTCSIVMMVGIQNNAFAEGLLNQPDDFSLKPFVQKYCVECHGKNKVKGDVDFTKIKSNKDILDNYKLWGTVEELVNYGDMPPAEEENQPNIKEIDALTAWYKFNFVNNIKAHPGFHQPKLLSLYEYDNTLRDLLGSKLTKAVEENGIMLANASLVETIFPPAVIGKSGFSNDTHQQELSFDDWLNYAYIADYAVEFLFSPQNSQQLSKYTQFDDNQNFSHQHAINFVKNFTSKAYRRQLTNTEVQAIKTSQKDPSPLAFAKLNMRKALLSHQFLFRGFNMEYKKEGQHRVNDTELAQRLSYFLWGSSPDDKLLTLANSQQLTANNNYKNTIKRLLADPKASSFGDKIASEWFGLDGIKFIKQWNQDIGSYLKQQPKLFMNYLIQEDRPLLELINSNVTFANKVLSQHYAKQDLQALPDLIKIPGREAISHPLHKMSLDNTPYRAGIITMPGILAMNSAPEQTSPIIRGAWVIERILGEHLGDPPEDIPPLKPKVNNSNLTFRERFEAHRSNKTCAMCHDKIDPLGFALESFDPKGAMRKFENSLEIAEQQKLFKKSGKRKVAQKEAIKGIPIDTAGQLPSGEKFEDIIQLKDILLEKYSNKITTNIVEHFLAYALGRELKLYDQPTVSKIVTQLNNGKGSYQQLIYLISTSLPFTHSDIMNNMTPSMNTNNNTKNVRGNTDV